MSQDSKACKEKRDQAIESIKERFPGKILALPEFEDNGQIVLVDESIVEKISSNDKDGIEGNNGKIRPVPKNFFDLTNYDEYPLTPLGNAELMLKVWPDEVAKYHWTADGEIWHTELNGNGGRLVMDYRPKGRDSGKLLQDCAKFAHYLNEAYNKFYIPNKAIIGDKEYNKLKKLRDGLEKRRNAFSAKDSAAKVTEMFKTMRGKILEHIVKKYPNEVVLLRKNLTAAEFENFQMTLNMRKVYGHCINCLNGVLDLRTMKLRPYTLLDMSTVQCNASYIPGAQCAEGLAFIYELMDCNPDRIKLLQMALGAAASGASDDHVKGMILLYGPSGNNGKSTLIGAIKIVFREANDANDPGYLTKVGLSMIREVKAADRSLTPDLYKCTSTGARFVSLSEPNKNERIDPQKFKDISGSSTINVEGKNKDSATGEWCGTMMMDCNEIPIIDDTVSYTSGRFALVPFSVKFADEGSDEAKLAKELGDTVCPRRADLETLFNSEKFRNWFLAWVVEGYQKWVANDRKFHTWEGQQDDLERCRKRSDKVYAFMCERYERSDSKEDKETVKALYDEYREWVNDNGYAPMGRANFVKDLQSNSYQVREVKHQDCVVAIRKLKRLGPSHAEKTKLCAFIDNHYEHSDDKNDKEIVELLYDEYMEWANDNGYATMGRDNFVKELIRNNYRVRRVNHQDFVMAIRKRTKFVPSRAENAKLFGYSVQDIKSALNEVAQGKISDKSKKVFIALTQTKDLVEDIYETALDNFEDLPYPVNYCEEEGKQENADKDKDKQQDTDEEEYKQMEMENG